MTSPADKLVVIRGRGRVSAMGTGAGLDASPVSPFTAHPSGLPVAALPPAAEAAVAQLRRAHPAYRQLDRTVLLALLAARHAAREAQWRDSEMMSGEVKENVMLSAAGGEVEASLPLANQLLPNEAVEMLRQAQHDHCSASHSHSPPHHLTTSLLAVSIGSSRGATGRLEEFHAEFLTAGTVPAAASPLTTLGNVASWVAFDAGQPGGAALSHSSTCSSAFQALGNALAWLRAGMATRFLAGGTEAPLTDFTLAQMRAIGIYSPFGAADWPCQPGAGQPSTFVLGEGAAVFALDTISREQLAQATAPVLVLEAVGFGFEAIGSKTGLSPDGQHFQHAIRQALAQAGCQPTDVDAVVLHSPGTPAGDAAERAALRAVFGADLPPLLSNKWLVGHTLGASAALSLDFACQVLETQHWPAPPFGTDLAAGPARPVRRVLVNAAGFGGNAASVVVALHHPKAFPG